MPLTDEINRATSTWVIVQNMCHVWQTWKPSENIMPQSCPSQLRWAGASILIKQKTATKIAETGKRVYLKICLPFTHSPDPVSETSPYFIKIFTKKWYLKINLVGRIRILFIVTFVNFRVSVSVDWSLFYSSELGNQATCVGHFRRFYRVI
jgi:hypothetical protein